MKQTREEKQQHRRDMLEGEMDGIYARNNWKIGGLPPSLPIDDKSKNEIVDHIAQHYVVLSCADWDALKVAAKAARKAMGAKAAKPITSLVAKYGVFLL